jgi:hypothetical protein
MAYLHVARRLSYRTPAVHADHDQAAVLELFMPARDIRQRPQAVNAGVGPEIDQDHLAAQTTDRKRLGVEPFLDANNFGSNTVVVQAEGPCASRRTCDGQQRRHYGYRSFQMSMEQHFHSPAEMSG